MDCDWKNLSHLFSCSVRHHWQEVLLAAWLKSTLNGVSMQSDTVGLNCGPICRLGQPPTYTSIMKHNEDSVVWLLCSVLQSIPLQAACALLKMVVHCSVVAFSSANDAVLQKSSCANAEDLRGYLLTNKCQPLQNWSKLSPQSTLWLIVDVGQIGSHAAAMQIHLELRRYLFEVLVPVQTFSLSVSKPLRLMMLSEPDSEQSLNCHKSFSRKVCLMAVFTE